MELVSPMADETPQNLSSNKLMFCVSGNGVHIQWCQHVLQETAFNCHMGLQANKLTVNQCPCGNATEDGHIYILLKFRQRQNIIIHRINMTHCNKRQPPGL
jgi:hypothetical protein